MRDLKTLAVLLGLFLTAALIAFGLSLPAWRIAEEQRGELSFWMATAWTIGVYLMAMRVVLRLVDRYRRHEHAVHCTNSVGRSQNS